MNTRHQIEEITRNQFARTALEPDGEGGYTIEGKWASADYLGNGRWDVWLRNQADLAKGIGARKLTNLINAIQASKNADTGPLRRLDGEAVYPSMATDTLLFNAHLLGIRRRRKATSNLPNHQQGASDE